MRRRVEVVLRNAAGATGASPGWARMRVALVSHSGEISGAEASFSGRRSRWPGGRPDPLRRAKLRRSCRPGSRRWPSQSVTAPSPRPASHAIRSGSRFGHLSLVRCRLSARRSPAPTRVPISYMPTRSSRADRLVWSPSPPPTSRVECPRLRLRGTRSASGCGCRRASGATRIVGNSNAVSTDFALLVRGSGRSHTRSIRVCLRTPSRPRVRRGLPTGAWGVPPRALRVGAASGRSPRKRVHDVIAAFRPWSPSAPQPRLVLVGAPSPVRRTRPTCEGSTGWWPGSGLGELAWYSQAYEEDIEQVFRSLDVLVHAAQREPFPAPGSRRSHGQGVPVVAVAAGWCSRNRRDRPDRGSRSRLGAPKRRRGARWTFRRATTSPRRRMDSRAESERSESFRADRACESISSSI